MTDPLRFGLPSVNYFGLVVLDTYVKPRKPVTDWRYHYSGVSAELVQGAPSFDYVREQVRSFIEGRILVGHTVWHDLRVLRLSHHERNTRDTSEYPRFCRVTAGQTPGLKKLTSFYLSTDIQVGTHSSLEDARATMLLYRHFRQGIDPSTRDRYD